MKKFLKIIFQTFIPCLSAFLKQLPYLLHVYIFAELLLNIP